MKTYPNPFLILINLALGLGAVSLMVKVPLRVTEDLIAGDFEVGMGFLMVLMFSLFGYFAFATLHQLVEGFCTLSIKPDGVKIFQPYKLTSKLYRWDELKGYSESEVIFGKFFWKSKSIVVYTKGRRVFEIIKIYNFNFKKVLAALEVSSVKRLGFESYKTGLYFRKYYHN